MLTRWGTYSAAAACSGFRVYITPTRLLLYTARAAAAYVNFHLAAAGMRQRIKFTFRCTEFRSKNINFSPPF